jgi:hypothetical protein
LETVAVLGDGGACSCILATAAFLGPGGVAPTSDVSVCVFLAILACLSVRTRQHNALRAPKPLRAAYRRDRMDCALWVCPKYRIYKVQLSPVKGLNEKVTARANGRRKSLGQNGPEWP